jgi:long-subunit fatty acid transport protein
MADIAWTGWSRMKILDLNYSATQQWVSPAGDTLQYGLNPVGTPAESAIVFNWKDVTRFSVGAEYHFRENWIARAGYYHDPSAIPDGSLNPLVIDFADKNSLNFGLSYKINAYEVGYNIEYINYDNRDITQIQDLNGDGLFDNFPGSYSTAQYSSFFYFTYRF